jgi:hypothetical protein
VINLVDSGWLRTSGYLLAATAAFVAGRREIRSHGIGSDWWPRIWFVAAAILLVMALVRGSDLVHLLPDLGRRRARSEGWYQDRRELQALVIAAVGAALVGTVAVVLWWVPANRRQYLPEAIVVLALVAFAAVRLVSLHQVDALLYRRRIHGVKLDAVIELVLLAAAIVLPLWPLWHQRDSRDG